MPDSGGGDLAIAGELGHIRTASDACKPAATRGGGSVSDYPSYQANRLCDCVARTTSWRALASIPDGLLPGGFALH
jgi:hypothetical protein